MRSLCFLTALSLGGWLLHDTLGAAAVSTSVQNVTGSTSALVGEIVDGDSGEPVSDAIITVGGRVDQVERGQNRSALTDSRGRFAISRLAPGLYRSPLVDAGGYSSYVEVVDGARDGVLPIREGIAHRLTIRVWRSAGIGGVVTDEAGEPVGDVSVRAFRRTTVAGRRRWTAVGTARTDGRGHYRIGGLRPGTYTIGITPVLATLPAAAIDTQTERTTSRTAADAAASQAVKLLSSGVSSISGNGPRVRDVVLLAQSGPGAPHLLPSPPKEGSVASAYAPVFYANAQSPVDANHIVVASGEERDDIDVQVLPTATASVSGEVADSNGPVEGAGLRLVRAADDGIGGGLLIATTASSASGRFTFLGIPPGLYRVEARVVSPLRFAADGGTLQMTETDGFRTMTFVDSVGQSAPLPLAPVFHWADSVISVSDVDVGGLSLTLAEGLRIRGTLEFRGTLPRPAPSILRSVALVIETADGSPISPMSATGRAVLDEFGAFETDAVPAGRYYLRIGSLPKGWTVHSVAIGGRDVSDEPISLQETILNARVVLTDKPTGLVGTVARASTQLGRELEVIVFPANVQRWVDYGLHPQRLRRTVILQGNGFEFTALPAGEYRLAAIETDRHRDWADPEFLMRLSESAERVTLHDHELARVHLRTSVDPTRHEKSIPEAAGEAKAHHIVSRAESGRGPFVATEEDGTEATTGSLASGVLRGRVINSAARPVRRALVRISGVNLGSPRFAIADEVGQFEFVDLPTGHFNLSASKAGYVTSWFGSTAETPYRRRTVTIGPQVASEAVIRMTEGASVSGVIVTAKGLPIRHVAVKALRVSTLGGHVRLTGDYSEVHADDRGAYRFDGLLPAKYLIVAEVPKGRPNEFALAIPTSERGIMQSSTPVTETQLVMYPTTYYPGTTDVENASVFSLTGGQQVLGVSITLRQNPSARIGGKIVFPPEVQAKSGHGARVTLRSTGREAVILRSVTADSGGRYGFGSVPPGQYSVMATARVEPAAGASARIAGSPTGFWAKANVPVAGGEDLHIDLSMTPAATLTGHVQVDIKTTLLEPWEQHRAEDLRIRLKSIESNPSTVVASAQPREDGSFTITGVLPGRYVISAIFLRNASAGLSVKSILLNGRDAQDAPLTIVDDTPLDGFIVTIGRGSTELAGAVLDETSARITDMLVLVFPASEPLWFQDCWRFRLPVRVSRTGEFRIRGLPEGEYFIAPLVEFDSTKWPDSSFLTEISEVAARVMLKSGETKLQDLRVAADR